MIDIIKNSFTNLSTIMWISQIMGLIGFVLIAVSYQLNKKNFLLISTISFLFFTLEAIFAGIENTEVISNAIVLFIGFLRNLLMYIFILKFNKTLPKYIIYILIGAIWIVEFIFFGIIGGFNNWLNYLPPLIVTVLTILQNSKNKYVLKLGLFINEAGCLTYYLLVGNMPFSVIRQVVLVISVLISVIVLIVKDIKTKKEISNEMNSSKA